MFTEFRQANINDLQTIRKFTDFWLSGRGLRVSAPGAVNDCFISPSQHSKYITKYHTYLLFIDEKLIGWAVVQNDNSLIHFLIAGTHRKLGLGKIFLFRIRPNRIHSKLDQSSGNPAAFYEKSGYVKVKTVKSRSRLDIDKIRPNRKPNIDIYELESAHVG